MSETGAECLPPSDSWLVTFVAPRLILQMKHLAFMRSLSSAWARWPAILALLFQASAGHSQLWVSSDFNHEVLQYDPDSGVVLADQPLIKPASGGLDQPHGILDRRSGVLIASFGTHEVKRHDRTTGEFMANFIPGTAGLNAPVYLAIGPHDGFLYVSSQGNDRIMRFDLETGAALAETPFISAGLLDGPSGFGWSPSGAVLFVAGRYSANVLAYDALTGAPLSSGHVFASGLGAGNTFGLAVDAASGDVFVATAGTVRRFSPGGELRATIPMTGVIGLENSPQGEAVYAAASNNLYRIAKSNHAVTGPFLTGPAINVLNFFHFSRVAEPELSPLTFAVRELAAGDRHFEFTFALARLTSGTTVTVQSSTGLVSWDDGAVYTMIGDSLRRDASPSTDPVSLLPGGTSHVVTEREPAALGGGPPRFFRIQVNAR